MAYIHIKKRMVREKKTIIRPSFICIVQLSITIIEPYLDAFRNIFVHFWLPISYWEQ